MSRVGKKPIPIPSGVDVSIKDQNIMVKGPLGQLEYSFPARINTEIVENQVIVKRLKDDREDRALHGLARALIANLVKGVSVGFTKTLIIEGVGYRAQMKGSTLTMNLGFSHPIDYLIPDGVSLKVEKNVLSLSGIDKQQVGQVAAIIRDFRKVEPYKGKGIRYKDEVVRRKVGKVGT